MHMDSESRCLTLSDDNMTASEFAAKIEWEGGIKEAYEYGLRDTHLAEALVDLRTAWKAFMDAMDDAADHGADFEYELEKALEQEEELD